VIRGVGWWSSAGTGDGAAARTAQGAGEGTGEGTGGSAGAGAKGMGARSGAAFRKAVPSGARGPRPGGSGRPANGRGGRGGSGVTGARPEGRDGEYGVRRDTDAESGRYGDPAPAAGDGQRAGSGRAAVGRQPARGHGDAEGRPPAEDRGAGERPPRAGGRAGAAVRGRFGAPAVRAGLTVSLVIALAACSSGGDGAPAAEPSGRTSPATRAAPPTPAPSPTVTYPLSTAPATVPAVRTHEPAQGPGWRPGPATGIVVGPGSGALADEGRLLAGELGITYRGAVPARAGDVELVLDPALAGGPESYTVRVSGNRVRISGPAEAGIFYGTRTLKQSVRSGGAMPEGVVRDAPDRPQRGLMIDTARKHFTAAWLEDRLRQMADLKLNQLGLHFSDDQGFRIESETQPGIVSREHLTKAEVRRLLALAASLHITVIPEIDSPGHLGAVLARYPELRLKDAAGRTVRGAIDIGNPRSARIVDGLLREYADLFPGAYWHLGGDEYQALTRRNPEASFPGLAALARREYGPGGRVQDLATDWINDRAAVLRPRGRTLKAWNDGYFRGGRVSVDRDIEVEYWTGKEIGARNPEEYLAEGRKVINVNDEYLYYVLGEPNDFIYPTGRRIYEQWTPLVLRGTRPVPASYSRLILGARFAVWCDLSRSQTPAQVARGIALPLAATAQKVWDPRPPARDWAAFRALANRVG
jgi:hexosaminidase